MLYFLYAPASKFVGDLHMEPLKIKLAGIGKWDLVSLGEIMLRLDPGDTRIATTRSFKVWEGGGEYNVARGLHRCFGLKTAVVTALADNPIGRLVQDLIYQGGVDQSHVKWVPYDGVGRAVICHQFRVGNRNVRRPVLKIRHRIVT